MTTTAAATIRMPATDGRDGDFAGGGCGDGCRYLLAIAARETMSLTVDEQRIVQLRKRDDHGHLNTVMEISILMNVTPSHVRKLEENVRRKLGVKRLGDLTDPPE